MLAVHRGLSATILTVLALATSAPGGEDRDPLLVTDGITKEEGGEQSATVSTEATPTFRAQVAVVPRRPTTDIDRLLTLADGITQDTEPARQAETPADAPGSEAGPVTLVVSAADDDDGPQSIEGDPAAPSEEEQRINAGSCLCTCKSLYFTAPPCICPYGYGGACGYCWPQPGGNCCLLEIAGDIKLFCKQTYMMIDEIIIKVRGSGNCVCTNPSLGPIVIVPKNNCIIGPGGTYTYIKPKGPCGKIFFKLKQVYRGKPRFIGTIFFTLDAYQMSNPCKVLFSQRVNFAPKP